MDKMKKVAQGGWHPERDRAAKPSYQQKESDSKLKNFKGLQQMAGWAGYKGSGGNDNQGSVEARPLTSLQDPAAFGAPPKRDPKAPLPPPKPKPSTASQVGSGTSAPNSPAKPGLPPALPPRASPSSPTKEGLRQDSFPTVFGHGLTSSTQSASSRLAAAGVSVPGFNIGSKPSPSNVTSSPESDEQQQPAMNTSTVRESFNQSQTALKPLSNYQQGKPVSFGELKSATAAASSLREKHGDQIAAGYRKAERTGLIDRAANATSSQSARGAGAATGLHKWIPSGAADTGQAATAAKKKPPPPPLPNRKPQMKEPPPIPFGSKPK